MDPGLWVPLGAFATAICLAIGVPMARAYARRMDAQSRQQIPQEVMARLERIESAVDAVAVEVERISEGQRFTTKLLSAKTAGEPALPSASQER